MGYLKWYGHAAFEFELDNVKGLIDPWLTNPLSPVKPNDIKDVDVILVTHDHGDHLGETVEIAKRTKATVIGIFELIQDLSGKGLSELVGMNIGGTYIFKGLKIHMVQAFHSCNVGSPVGFIVEGKETTFYHTGDTALFSDMKLFKALYNPKIALLPIGSHFTMGPMEALKAIELLEPEVVIPMHYNTFPVIVQDPEEFKKVVKEKYPNVEVVVLKPGESYTF